MNLYMYDICITSMAMYCHRPINCYLLKITLKRSLVFLVFLDRDLKFLYTTQLVAGAMFFICLSVS